MQTYSSPHPSPILLSLWSPLPMSGCALSLHDATITLQTPSMIRTAAHESRLHRWILSSRSWTHTQYIDWVYEPSGSADGLVPDSSPSGWEFDSHGKLCFSDGFTLGCQDWGHTGDCRLAADQDPIGSRWGVPSRSSAGLGHSSSIQCLRRHATPTKYSYHARNLHVQFLPLPIAPLVSRAAVFICTESCWGSLLYST